MRTRGGGCLEPIVLGVLWLLEKLIEFIIQKIWNKSEGFIRNLNIFLIMIILCEVILFLILFLK